MHKKKQKKTKRITKTHRNKPTNPLSIIGLGVIGLLLAFAFKQAGFSGTFSEEQRAYGAAILFLFLEIAVILITRGGMLQLQLLMIGRMVPFFPYIYVLGESLASSNSPGPLLGFLFLIGVVIDKLEHSD